MAKSNISKPGGSGWTVPLTIFSNSGAMLANQLKDKLNITPVKTGTKSSGSGSSGSSGTSASSKAGASGGSSAPSDEAVLNQYYNTLKSVYQPEKVAYTPKSEASLTEEIAAWLRPGYDAAITRRQQLTDAYHAELDADAIARGMGQSTYVTDVKSRQKSTEAADIMEMESDYSASLAKYVSDAVEQERARTLEVEMFNSERTHEVYMQAYETALGMFAAYKARRSSGGGSGGSGSSGSASGSGGKYQGVVTTTPENCELFVSGLSNAQKRDILLGRTEMDKQYRAELVASVGEQRYIQLMAAK